MATNRRSLPSSGADLGEVDVEVADRVGGEALPLGLVAPDLGQPADPVPLEAAMQRRPREVRDRGLEAVEAVVQRQERVAPERDDDGFLLWREDGRADLLRPHPGVRRRLPLAPLLDRGGADAEAAGERPHALLT
jgi:hypothetical protein